MLPGPPTVFQTILNHPDLAVVRPVERCARRSPAPRSCRSRSIARMRDELQHRERRHRLRPDRDHRHGQHVPPRRPARGRSPTPSASRSPASRCASSTTTAPTWPPGEPASSSVRGLQRDEGLLRRPRGDRRPRSHDGWLRTGDIGFVDDDGNLHITDRKKDMFIVGGFNAYPAEIEAHAARPPRRRPGRGRRRARRAHGRGRRGLRRRPHRRTTLDPDARDRVGPRADGQLQGAAPGRAWSTSCRSTPSGKVMKFVLRERASS